MMTFSDESILAAIKSFPGGMTVGGPEAALISAQVLRDTLEPQHRDRQDQAHGNLIRRWSIWKAIQHEAYRLRLAGQR
jgi:hypothetical protein